MTWLAIIRLLLGIADKVADIVRSQQLLDAGSRAEIAVQLARIAERLRATEEIRLAVESLTDAEIDEELAGHDESFRPLADLVAPHGFAIERTKHGHAIIRKTV